MGTKTLAVVSVLCSAIVKQHRPDLRVALQDVRVQVAVVLHLRRCQRKYDTYVDVLVTFSSLDCFSRLQDRHRHVSAVRSTTSVLVGDPLLLLSYVAFNPRHASSPLLTSVFFTVTRALPLHNQCQSKIQLKTVLLETLLHHCCDCDLVFLHRSPTQCFDRLGIRGSLVRGENWKDHSGQSMCSPANVGGALPIVRVSTGGAVTFGTAATCCRVIYQTKLALSVPDVPSTPPCQLSSELPPSLRLERCFVIGSTPDVAPLPRLRIFLFCLVSLDTNCSSTPQYTCTTAVHHCLPVPPPEVTSLSYAASACIEVCSAR